jgi:hypothetical protein
LPDARRARSPASVCIILPPFSVAYSKAIKIGVNVP